MPRCVFLTLCVLTFGSAYVFGASLRSNANPPLQESSWDQSVCNTDECRIIAALMRTNINESANPCDDFYEYACGGWSSYHSLKPYAPKSTTWGILGQRVANQIRDILKRRPNLTDSLPLRLAKKWYRSCMDVDTIERYGVSKLASILEVAGGWPMAMKSNSWNEGVYTTDSVDAFYALASGTLAFYEPNIFPRELIKMPKSAVLLKPPKLPLSEYVISDTNRAQFRDDADYANFIVEAVKLISKHNGIELLEKDITKDVQDMVTFEDRLHKLTMEKLKLEDSAEIVENDADMEFGGKKLADNENDYDAMYEDDIESIRRLIRIQRKSKTNYRQKEEADRRRRSAKNEVQLMRALDALFNVTSVNTDDLYVVIPPNFLYFKELSNLLDDTPHRVIINYIHWNFLSNMLPRARSEMAELHFKVWSKYIGVEEQLPRWRTCLTEVKMEAVISYEYVKKYFPEKGREIVTSIVNEVRGIIKKDIEQTSWMSTTLKNTFKEKLEKMQSLLGYPEWYRNSTAMMQYYKGLMIGNRHVNNVITHGRFTLRRKFQNLAQQQYGDIRWHIQPTSINAVYVALQNSLTVTAVDFQPPFFGITLPDSYQFGVMGFIIGHEVSHGFDPKGSLFDKDGKSISWDADERKEYDERKQCVLDKYGNYTIELPGNEVIKVNANKTSHENMADVMGLKAVYRAFKRWTIQKNHPTGQLPGLERYNEDQLFFLSAANLWCGQFRPEYLRAKAEADEHSAYRVRVIGSMSNMQEFSETFDCPKGTRMNPEKKCNMFA